MTSKPKVAAKKVKAQPEEYHTVTPYMIVHDGAGAIEFYKKAFGAKELMRMPGPDGKIGHAEIKIGDSTIMLADEAPTMNILSARTLKGSPVSIMLYVDNVDKVAQTAVKLGAKLSRPVEDKFYGDRSCTIENPYGHTWNVSTHIEDVPPEEMAKRAAAEAAKAPK